MIRSAGSVQWCSAGGCGLLVKSGIASLVAIAALHLIAGAFHHYAHVVADVPNSPLQMLFILLVVTIAPWAAIYLAWRRTVTLGAALFSSSMAASLAFGLILHFAIESPDLHSNVAPEHGTVFLYSALGLAAVELAGFVVGLRFWLRGRSSAW